MLFSRSINPYRQYYYFPANIKKQSDRNQTLSPRPTGGAREGGGWDGGGAVGAVAGGATAGAAANVASCRKQ